MRSNRTRLAICLAVSTAVLLGHAQAVLAEDDDASELAKKTQNPIADLISLPFQNNLSFGAGRHDEPQNTLNIQPVIPISLGSKLNLITRTIVPIVSNPPFRPQDSRTTGLGDTSFSAFFSPTPEEPPIDDFLIGLGPVVLLPTATSSKLGNQKWGLGPTAVFVWMPGKWVVGSLFSNIWSVGGRGSEDVNLFTWQYFVNYNIANGWYLTSAPIINANWENNSGDTWTVPVGGGGGRVWKFEGFPPINTQVQAFYNVARPSRQAAWQLRLQVQLLFPKPKGSTAKENPALSSALASSRLGRAP